MLFVPARELPQRDTASGSELPPEEWILVLTPPWSHVDRIEDDQEASGTPEPIEGDSETIGAALAERPRGLADPDAVPATAASACRSRR